MKQLILLTALLVLTGIRSANASRCNSYEIQKGCYTELGMPSLGSPHGRPVCECPMNGANEGEHRSSLADDVPLSSEAFDQK